MIKLLYIADFSESYPYRLLKGIMAAMQGRPFSVLRMPTVLMRDRGMNEVVRIATQAKITAVIGQFEPDDRVDLLVRQGFKVFAQDYISRFTNITNITGSYAEQGREAANYFLAKGFHSFAFFGYRGAVWSEERFHGFHRRLLECDIPEERIFCNRNQQLENQWYYDSDELAAWLRQLPRSTALFAADDSLANRVAETSLSAGIRIPTDLALLGVDDDDIACTLTTPQLSSISLDVYNAGQKVARSIMRMLVDDLDKTLDIVVRSTGIVERQSSDILATDDPDILRVLSYINTRLSHRLDMKELLTVVPMSRRSLEMRFRKITGLSVHQYIMEHRMQHLAQRLISSTESIGNLAMEVGIGDQQNVSRLFQKYYNTTPEKYRGEHRRFIKY